MSDGDDSGVDRSESLLGVYARGIAMGAADAVPGVSGGTIALITGIYDRLVAAIAAVNLPLVRRFFHGLVRDRTIVVETLEEADAPFLLALAAGIATALATVVPVLAVALGRSPVATFGFFFGLIAASVIVLRDGIAVGSARGVIATAAGVLLAFVTAGAAPGVLGDSVAATVVAGAVTLSATLLPGLSGSLVLVVIGQYERIVAETIPAFFTGLAEAVAAGSLAPVREPAVTTIAFLAGGVVGVLSVANLVRRVLARDRTTTLTFLIGLVIGALRAPVTETTRQLTDAGRTWTPSVVGLFVAAAIVGALVVGGLDRAVGGIEP